MVHDLSQQVQPNANSKTTGPRQAVAGLMPPELGEGMIREVFPTVLDTPGLGKLAQGLVRTVFLAPLGWMILAPLYFKKILPFLSKRYTLTNRRLMIRRGLKPKMRQEVKLEEIDDVRLDPASHDGFYHSGTLEVLSGGQVKMRLTGVPEPEGFRQAILNAVKAWVPGKAKGPFQPASAIKA
jgi:hypothetical protein